MKATELAALMRMWLQDGRRRGTKVKATELRLDEVALTLQERGIAPDETYTAAAGHDWGYVQAWQLYTGSVYLVSYGDNGQTAYALTDDVTDLASWLLPGGDDGCDGTEDAPVIVANIRGIEAVAAADPTTERACRILVATPYYGPTERTDWLRGDNGEPIEYDTYAQAQATISELEGEPTYLAHNQSGAHTHKIVEV